MFSVRRLGLVNIGKFMKFRQYVSVNNNRPKAATFLKLGIPIGLTIFGFGRKDEEENPEDKLVMMIKRSILCIQREQFEKAEQMLHLALRMAQDLQNRQGVTYVFDVMANLAMEREQFIKAEKLFTDVMRRLMEEGVEEDNIKILHISSKLAHMAQMQGELEKSELGFTWTMKKLENLFKAAPEDESVRQLLALTEYWYGQLLMKMCNYEEAKNYFKNAYEAFITIYGSDNKECITILNNLAVACENLGNLTEAKSYLIEALKMGRTMADFVEEGVMQANLGLIMLKQGLIDEAKSACALAWKFGSDKKDKSSIEQAEYCLNEIKNFDPNLKK